MGTVRYTVVDGEVISEKRGGVRKSYVPDPLGSTVALLDNTQTQTDTFTYWPYGEVKTRTGTMTTPFQFVGTLGYYRDSSSRDYVRARHLRKDLARWQTEDPSGLKPSEGNLHRYAFGSPGRFADPSGLDAFGNPSCPWVPQLACWMCWYRKLQNGGWEPKDACQKAKENCAAFSLGAAAPNGIDCDSPPPIPGTPPRPKPHPPIPNPGDGYPFPCLVGGGGGDRPFGCEYWCEFEYGMERQACIGLCRLAANKGCDFLYKACFKFKNNETAQKCLGVYLSTCLGK